MSISLQITTAPTGTSPAASARAASCKAAAIQNESSAIGVGRPRLGAVGATAVAPTDHCEFTHGGLTEQRSQPDAARQAYRPCRGHQRYARQQAVTIERGKEFAAPARDLTRGTRGEKITHKQQLFSRQVR